MGASGVMVILKEKKNQVRVKVKSAFFHVGVAFVMLILSQQSSMALSISEAIEALANRLNIEQIKNGHSKGSWPGESNLTGSIVAGIASAYERKCNIDYQRSAQWGGDYILWAAQGNYYGDEIYTLMRLSQIASDPCDNAWRTAVDNFYYNVKYGPGGTEGYISNFHGTESSTAVFYMSNLVVAAYYIDSEDKQIWRKGLIEMLSQVDDSSYYPIMALGAATWALALTGPLDETSIHSSGEGAPYWKLKKLADLPELLLSHQVKDGQPGAGSFYWQFGHTDNSPNGYTEDAIFATRGLIAAYWANPDPDLRSAILSSYEALLDGINSDGRVWERLSQEGSIFYVYAGEMLQVLSELIVMGDLDLDGRINYTDYAIFINNWNASDCSQYCCCYGADFDKNGIVNFVDVKIMADHWLNDLSYE
jgi:hypothetical protein